MDERGIRIEEDYCRWREEQEWLEAQEQWRQRAERQEDGQRGPIPHGWRWAAVGLVVVLAGIAAVLVLVK